MGAHWPGSPQLLRERQGPDALRHRVRGRAVRGPGGAGAREGAGTYAERIACGGGGRKPVPPTHRPKQPERIIGPLVDEGPVAGRTLRID